MDRKKPESHLDVYENRYELHQNDVVSVYYEGYQNADAQRRYAKINHELEHGFMQAMHESHLLGDLDLVPMSQMRSANKKHGNIGDVELREGRVIVEAWDAKYGKPYLRDELEELRDKILRSHMIVSCLMELGDQLILMATPEQLLLHRVVI